MCPSAIGAPPGTAALVTCLGAFGELPDLVASGINPGANTGHLVLHSGTVGATLTAASYGVPGVAVSLEWNVEGDYRWETAAAYGAAAVEWVAKPDTVTRPQRERPEPATGGDPRRPRGRAGLPR